MNQFGSFPFTRLRRLRKSNFIANLIQETKLSCSDLIYPVFIIEGHNIRQEIKSLPGIYRLSIDALLKEAEELQKLKISAIAIFPYITKENKTLDAAEAYNSQGLVQRAIYALKQYFPDFGVISDIALDPYTTHGQDGILDISGYILNDETVDILVKQALSHALMGADIVAPSDMMDGRVGAIRKALEHAGFYNTKILAYSAKYASNLYSPFREAVGSKDSLGKSQKFTYQMDPHNSNEAIREAALDIQEGADILMVKPASWYLDILYRIKQTLQMPTFAYQVSGEYAMQIAASDNDWLNLKNIALESLICIKRAGADAILSYHAKNVAKILLEN